MVVEPIDGANFRSDVEISFPILGANAPDAFALNRTHGKTMKPRVLALYLGLAGLALTAAIIAAFAFNASHTQKVKDAQPKNNMVFNWGSSS